MSADRVSRNDTSLTPIYIFSLPRSGSTLLQRMIASHPSVSTRSEPWFLLPLFYAIKEEGSCAEYSHATSVRAFRHFAGKECQCMWRNAVRRFGRVVYGQAADESSVFFLDKTPRYHLVVNELIETMEEARFIFLWRNPLAIAASIMNTWGEGYYNLFRYRLDLYRGVKNLVQAWQTYSERSVALRYEDLVQRPQHEMSKLAAYLGIEYRNAPDEKFSEVELSGPLGDPKRTQESRIDPGRASGWETSYCNPLRRRWARSYLEWIGNARLSEMGYSRDEIELKIDGARNGLERIAGDLLHLLKDSARAVFDPAVIDNKNRSPLLENWLEYS